MGLFGAWLMSVVRQGPDLDLREAALSAEEFVGYESFLFERGHLVEIAPVEIGAFLSAVAAQQLHYFLGASTQ